MIKLRVFIPIVVLTLLSATVIRSQVATATPPATADTQTDEEKQKEKEALEKKAVSLLEQVISDVQMLKLPDNRIRVQIAAGDLLWKRNEARARSMLSLAADGIAEAMRNNDGNSRRWSIQLRQELVLAAARHDAPLAYQLLAATRSSVPADASDNPGRPNADTMLEQNLLAQVARLDPKFAAQKAEEALEKDQFPLTLARVLAELQNKDKEAFTRLSQKVASRLQTANMLANSDSGSLALSLLQPGPRGPENPAESSAAPVVNQRGGMPLLSQSAFTDVLGTVIDAALKATAPSATQRAGNTRAPGNPRGRGPGVMAAIGPGGGTATLSDAQIEQNNARRLLLGLQGLLPQIDQYAPARATAVRQKLTEVGVGNNPRQAFGAQYNSLMQQGTADSLLQAAPIAPPQMQTRLYQQAALKALDEGNADRARQIANEHLDPRTRASVLERVDFQLIANKAEADNMDQLRQTLAQLSSDDQRIDLLLQMAASTQAKDQKLALKLLGEAQRLTNRHATGYSQFEQQLRVADAFATLDSARSFEVLDPGIGQLNELMSAAAVLSGFEVNVFRDGEMPLEPTNSLASMVLRYGQELASLAKLDFERAEISANKFQLAEPRLIARLAIVRGILGTPERTFNRGFGGGGGFGRRPE